MNDSKRKLVSVRVTHRMADEIERIVEDTGKDRPDVLREIVAHGICSYESSLYDRTPDPMFRMEWRRYRERMLNDDDDAVEAMTEHMIARFSEIECLVKQLDDKLESIAVSVTNPKKKGFFR